jgi:hypothetical protein
VMTSHLETPSACRSLDSKNCLLLLDGTMPKLQSKNSAVNGNLGRSGYGIGDLIEGYVLVDSILSTC